MTMCQGFKWDGDWRNTQIACASCGWHGVLEEKALIVSHLFNEAGFCCPNCEELLAVIEVPTRADIEKSWDELTAEQRQLFSDSFDRDDEDEKARLTSPAQLPDIAADSIILVWDLETRGAGEEDDGNITLIKYEGECIWQERAPFQCVGYFDDVVTVLQKKYGNRLKDLVPSDASKTYLYGDDLFAHKKLAEIRSRLPQEDVDAQAVIHALARSGDRAALNTLRFECEYAAHHLESVAQLPQVQWQHIVLTWDISEDPPCVVVTRDGNHFHFDWAEKRGDGFVYLTIRHADSVIWREAASDRTTRGEDGELHFGFVERYIEITTIFREKYGERLRDLTPTDRSAAYVSGMAWDALSKARRRLFPCGSKANVEEQVHENPCQFAGGEILHPSTRLPTAPGSGHHSEMDDREAMWYEDMRPLTPEREALALHGAFRLLKFRGTDPNSLPNPQTRQQYIDWLKANP